MLLLLPLLLSYNLHRIGGAGSYFFNFSSNYSYPHQRWLYGGDRDAHLLASDLIFLSLYIYLILFLSIGEFRVPTIVMYITTFPVSHFF
uniref:Secreted protein n=1 Tax=Anopheles darlingi TaxID=43151 RepID=A0A2M4D780_ANODA